MTYLQSVAIRNFKAIRSSGTLKLGPLTVFIGNNGSGKSSVIEAMEAYRAIVLDGLDVAMEPFLGFEHVWHKAALARAGDFRHQAQVVPSRKPNPMSFAIRLRNKSVGPVSLNLSVNMQSSGNAIYIQEEQAKFRGTFISRDSLGARQTVGEGRSLLARVGALDPLFNEIRRWQFLFMEPGLMGVPKQQKRSSARVLLDRNGANLAEYLVSLRNRDLYAFNGVVDALRAVLPYAEDVKPELVNTGAERRAFLQMLEKQFEIPGWMLSSGTLRVLALLALLRDPEPPPVIFIEEMEDGLDPRTIGMLVEEIRRAVSTGRTQIVATTHSPYLLDLLLFEHVVVVEREASGEPVYWRPDDERSLDVWRKDFSLGKIYAMGQLHRARKVSSKFGRRVK